MRNFTNYIRTNVFEARAWSLTSGPTFFKILFASILILSMERASAVTSAYSESTGGDLPVDTITPLPTFTLGSGAGVYTVDGTVETPTDYQDAFNIVVPAGFQITSVQFSLTGDNGFNGFMNFNAMADTSAVGGIGTFSGTYNIVYPLAPGTYSALVGANFSVGNSWTYTYTIAAIPGATPPANDDACSAIPLSVGVNGPYDNTNATTQVGEVFPPVIGDCYSQTGWCSNGGSTTWFTLVASASGHDTILSPDFDTQLALWDVTTCGDFTTYTLIAADDDEGENHGGQPFSSWLDAKCLTPGHTYYLQLSGNSGTTGTTTINVGSVANQPPVLTACPANINGCNTNPTWTAPTATDPEGCGVTVVPDHASGSTFPAGTTTVTYTATDAQGATATCNFTVTVVPPTVNTVSDQTVCNGSSTSAVTFSGTATTFDWTGSNSTIGLASSGSGNIASFVATNTGTAPVTDVITVTPKTGGCTGTPTSFNITVNPAPTVNGVSNQTVCNGTGTTTVTFSGAVTGTVYNWTGTDGTIGILTSGAGNIASFTGTNTGTAPVTDAITVTPSYTNNGVTCTGTPTSFNITVNPTPTVNGVSDQTVCNGTATTTVTFSGAVTGTVYNWTGTDGTIGIPTSGAGNIVSFTGTNTGTAPVTDAITVTPSYTNNGVACSGTPVNFNITVNPTPTVNGVSDQTVCNGAPTTTVTYSGAVTGTAYDWTGTDGTIGILTSGTGNITSFTATNTGTTPVTDALTVTPSYTNNGVACTGTPTNFNITVNPTPGFDPAPGSFTVCNNSPASVTFNGTVAGTVFDWTGTDGTIGAPTSGSGNITTFTATNTGTTPVIDTIIVIPSYTNAGVTCSGTPDTFTITVNPTPFVDSVPGQTLCNGSSTTAVIFTGTTAGTDYIWTGSNATIGLAASGTGDIASFVATNGSNLVVVDTIIVTPSFTGGGTTCTGTPDTFLITVNPTPNVQQPNDQIVCNTDSTATITFQGTVAGTVFDWTGTNGTIGIATSGTGDIASFPTINTGNVPVIDTLIVTPSYTNGSVTCTGKSDTFTITVNPTPIITPSADQQLCNGDTTHAVPFTSTVVGTTFAWVNTNSSVGLASSGSGDVPSFTAINPTTSDLIDTIIVIPTSSVGCTGAADTFTITIHPTPLITLGPNVTQCLGSVQIDAGNAGSTFVWSDGATTQIDTVSTSGLYTVTVTSPFGCIDSASKTIYIKPAPSVNIGPDSTYCGGTVTLDAGNAGDTYLWSNGATSQQITVSASGTYSVIVSDTASGCTGYDTAVITFSKVPVVTLGADTTLCGGTLTLRSINDPGSTYSWTGGSTADSLVVTSTGTYGLTVTTAGGCSASGSIHVTIFSKPNLGPDVTDSICPGSTADLFDYFQSSGLTLTYSTATPTTVDQGVYQVVGTNANGCSDTANVTIIYRQKPDLGPDNADSVCPGYTYNLRSLYPNSGYATYAWSNTFNDTAVGPGTYSLVVSNASGCTDTVSVTITNRTRPSLGGNKSDSICQHYTYDLTTLYPNAGYTSYTWTGVADPTAVLAGVYQLVVANGSGCTDTAYATIAYRAQPIVTLATSPDVCSTVPAFTLTGGAPAGGTYFINNVISSVFDPSLLGTGPQRVVYAYTNASGCTDSAVTTITIFPQPVITLPGVLPTVCTNSQAIDLNQYFSPTGGSFFGPGVSGQYFYPSLTNAGPDSITYVFTDSHGCMDTAGRTIIVSDQVHVSLHTNTTNFTICQGDSIAFFATGATDYQFFVNGVAVTAMTDTAVFSTRTLNDHDQVSVVGSNGCSTDTSDIIIIDVNAGPVADAGRDTTIELGQTAQLNGSATGGTGNLTYNWTPGTYLNFNNVPNPKFNGPDTTFFIFRVTDANGCFDTASVTVNVHVPDNVLLPNLITPNGDGQNDAWVLNPKINLAGSHLLIFNRWGEKVYETDSYANNWKGTYMDSNDKLPDGTYYYVLKVPAQNNHEYTGPINILSSQH